MTTSPIDPNRLLLTGENPYIRLSETDGGPTTTDASFWRILFSPGGPGHVLFLQSELTGNGPRIYTDNIQMTRWLQGEIQGRINPTFGNLEIPAREASFGSAGDLRSYWTEKREGPWRRDCADLVRPGRALHEPHLPLQQPRAAPRGGYSADTGQRGTAHHQRKLRQGQAFPPSTRRPDPQHLRPGLLRVLDPALLN